MPIPEPTPANQSAARIDAILAAFEALYGVPHWRPGLDPMDELIGCILSQHTSDVNSERAFHQLKAEYPTWNGVISAPVESVSAAIRSGGLANLKAARIQAVLAKIEGTRGEVSLDFLRAMCDEGARRYLMSLPGVGPKTAAIVLCFALGRPVLPVDTHVFRVAWRLGLVERRAGEARAHDLLQTQLPPDLVFRFHMALVRHGRAICRAPRPRCAVCPVTAMCWYYSETGAHFPARSSSP